jgi:hypothetical protein
MNSWLVISACFVCAIVGGGDASAIFTKCISNNTTPLGLVRCLRPYFHKTGGEFSDEQAWTAMQPTAADRAALTQVCTNVEIICAQCRQSRMC